MQRNWIIKKICKHDTVPSWGAAFHPILLKVLLRRSISSYEDALKYLSPGLRDMLDPLLLKGIEPAVRRLLSARQAGETVCIYGDYDVDGITGTALLVSFLREVGFCCHYFIPNRFDDGYGLNRDALGHIIEKYSATLIISVDCGITSIDEALFCRQKGVDLIITDHHTPREAIPDAVAVINPLQPGCTYPFKSLAGVGVAFNLLIALRAILREEGFFGAANGPDLRQWLDLVALGTIADVVPLIGQNRIYAFHGLRHLSSSAKVGIQSLKRVAGIGGIVSCGQVGFLLAPRLNAAGRMESAVPGVELLLGAGEKETFEIATDLDAANSERQAVERRIFEEAVEMVEASRCYPACRSIVLASDSWHQGVVGIVASRLVERYHRPTILIALTGDGIAKGSGRSIPGFHLLNALTSCSDHLARFGGHSYAAGIGLKEELVDTFAAAFEAESSRLLNPEDLIPTLIIDAEAHPENVTIELARELKRLEPFGAGNPEPVLMMRGLTIIERRVVGENHLRLRLSRDGYIFYAIAFRMAERETAGMMDIAFYPEINEWNGSSSLQLRIKDLRPSEHQHAA
ncbi:single-stranded-DNA-specific exonuclease RecJ [Pelotalea chapellei]|uniref:Single-stranded-DNA-specific exonuclease RecJ n=1 Tax=Pelotalea chapellei TaxID=44671 RepID=A0ABS5U7T0_9BACT|nr:single-stranded-DNA-specific exonuclease RecJ [Pelotalea chapellei]MBT1071729.1 single-stranded-DNA-specific exonuclease RecJ [Pelotalea chapellei]